MTIKQFTNVTYGAHGRSVYIVSR